MKKGLLLALLVSGLSQAEDFQLYGKAGFPSVAIGGAYGVNENVTVRAEVGTLGSISRKFENKGVDWDAKLDTTQFSVLGDYFPMQDSGFRVSAGLAFNDFELKATGKATQAGTIKINDNYYSYDAKDNVSGKVEYPNVMPYIGIGWGHNVKQQKTGFSWTADLGVYIGKPSTSITVSDSLRGKIAATGRNADREIDKTRQDLADKVDYKVIPAVSLGFTYTF